MIASDARVHPIVRHYVVHDLVVEIIDDIAADIHHEKSVELDNRFSS